MTDDDATVLFGRCDGQCLEGFSGDNEVTIADSGVPDFDVSDDTGETYGDLSMGFGILAPDGWSGFLRANYLFAEDYDAIAGNAGLRYSW
jgi:autotransporter family porin